MRLLILIPALLLTACTPFWEREAVSHKDTTWDRPMVAEAREVQGQPAELVTQSATMADLDALVLWGVDRNPQVRAGLSGVERAAHRVDATGTLPPPRLAVAPVGDMAQTGAGEVLVMTSLTQQFPAPGTLNAEVMVASAAVERAEGEVHRQRVATAQAIRRAWWQWDFSRRSLKIVHQQVELLEQLRSQMLETLEAGAVRQSDVVRLGVEIDTLKAQKFSWRQRITTAAADLRQALSISAATPLPPTMGRSQVNTGWNRLAIMESARNHRPDIHINDADLSAATALASGAKARRLPDFGFSVNYNLVDDENLMGSTSGDDQWWVGVNVSLPLWFASYDASEAEAEAARRQATFARLGIEDALVRDIDAALAAWNSAGEQLALYEGGILDGARQALESETADYVTGAGSFASLIQAANALLMLDMSKARLERDRGLAESRILAAAGVVVAEEGGL